jgi:hypothetical protein
MDGVAASKTRIAAAHRHVTPPPSGEEIGANDSASATRQFTEARAPFAAELWLAQSLARLQADSVHVNGRWCITFEFDEGDACRIDFEQYH